MKLISRLVVMFAVVTCASCAQPSRPEPVEKPALSGSHFDAVGTVALHPGQPCAVQIMFDFHRARSRAAVWLAAPMRESTILTDAVHRRSRVHVVGKWRRGKQNGCSFVDVANVELLK